MRRLDRKVVVIINGKGGAGKDTVCEIAGRQYRAKTISAIDPIKNIARLCGWDGGKDNKSRKFLSDLKRLLIDYNDLPNSYLIAEHGNFMRDSAHDILFVHIRENDQIADFKSRINSKCVTLLVRAKLPDGGGVAYGNDSDDNVEDYGYDYVFANDVPLEILEHKFLTFFGELLDKEGIREI